jgi:hypothetical protein
MKLYSVFACNGTENTVVIDGKTLSVEVSVLVITLPGFPQVMLVPSWLMNCPLGHADGKLVSCDHGRETREQVSVAP